MSTPVLDDRLGDDELRRWLQEDAPHGDLTTRSLGVQAEPARLSFTARRDMRVALIEEAARLFELCGAQAEVILPSGCDALAGTPLLTAHGRAGALLLAWKVAQTAVEVASGMASEAARIIGLLRAEGWMQPLACTRKTVPGGRALACRAVTAGGAVMHRLGLSESLLVFPEHRLFIDAAALPQRLAAAAGAFYAGTAHRAAQCPAGGRPSSPACPGGRCDGGQCRGLRPCRGRCPGELGALPCAAGGCEGGVHPGRLSSPRNDGGPAMAAERPKKWGFFTGL